jgi:hypothetical protein
MSIVNNLTKLPNTAIEGILSSLRPKDRAALATASREHGTVVRNSIATQRAKQQESDLSRLVADLTKLKGNLEKHYPYLMDRAIVEIGHVLKTIKALGTQWNGPKTVSDGIHKIHLTYTEMTPVERGDALASKILEGDFPHDARLYAIAMRLIKAMVKEFGAVYFREGTFDEIEQGVNSNRFTAAIVHAIPGVTVEGVEGVEGMEVGGARKASRNARSQKARSQKVKQI